MYALFLESKAAQQIDAYVAENGGDAEEIKQKAYHYSTNTKDIVYGRGKTLEAQSSWWVNRCLKDDSHKNLDINSLFTWHETEEGKPFWLKINKYF